ncbi:MAG TPA: 2-hydroxyacyl-CoA dehydratase family protein [Smithella sp.]|nr:2-hydroxyacyl-CoA dehydratase family protein [Smithella sp.]
MKRETKEYPYDWNLWTILENAAKTPDGFRKEYEQLLPYVYHYKDVLDTFVRQGEPGILFLKLLAKYMKDCVTARARGKKVAMTTFCLAIPVLYAFDVQPLALEVWSVLGTIVLKRGTAEFLDYCCELGFTETSCSAQRGALGAYLSGLGVKPDFIICDSPGVCDTNANSFAFAAAYLDLPFYQLNYPSTLTEERSEQYHRDDYRGLIKFLEEQTGRKLDMDKLGEIIRETRKQDELACEIFEMLRVKPSPIPAVYDLLLYGGKFMMGGLPEYTLLLQAMVKKAKENMTKGIAGTASGREKARGLFCYIDHYTTDARMWSFLESRDISHLGSLLFGFWQREMPYAKGREEEAYGIDDRSLDAMIDSLAAMNSRMPMVKQIRGPYDMPHMWRDDVLGCANLMKPDFITYMGTIGCRNTWGMVKLLAKDLEKAGYPTLVLYGDGFDDRVQSWESITDKIEEFTHVRGILR